MKPPRRTLGIALAATLACATNPRPADAEPTPIEISGPAMLCFMYTRLQLLPGERVTDLYLGFHVMSAEIAGPHGDFTFVEGNHFASPTRLGAAVVRTPSWNVRRRVQGGRVSYAVMGTADFAPDEVRLLASLHGPALSGADRDRRIYGRVEVAEMTREPCDHRFGYAWIAP
jgi:hypothetical protein